MEAIPDMRMETEDRQSTEYEVHHQKLVNTYKLPSYTSLDSDLMFPRGRVSSLFSLVKSQGCHYGADEAPHRGVCGDHLDEAPHLLLLVIFCALCICKYLFRQPQIVLYPFCIQSLISFRIVMSPAQNPQSILVAYKSQTPLPYTSHLKALSS